uniref:glutathione transferase n=1 Tax=Phallusia mammillata TaxID=59560 RepID=A0A6F9DL06_9ASCI|nr:glutathione S-transferase 1 [Phallusia mammillata]
MPAYKLTYFDVRGLAEMSRYVFAEAGVQYEDVRIKSDDWPKLKPSTPFGKMPYLSVDGKEVAHSRAIVRFLGREFRLDGGDSLTAARLDVWIEQLFETYSSMPWTEEDEDQKAKLLATWEKETLAPKLEKLGGNKCGWRSFFPWQGCFHFGFCHFANLRIYERKVEP